MLLAFVHPTAPAAVQIAESGLPNCVSHGATKSEALENVQDAIAACLAVRSEREMPLTVETQQVEAVA